MGRLSGIWIKRSHGGVMDVVDAAELVVGRGLQGNATQGGRRQVTLLSLDRWRAATAHLPGPPDPALRRANLLVEGVDLEYVRGRMLAIGGARLRIFGETRACYQMDEACPGLQAALAPPWAGGAFAEVVSSGTIAVGAEVTFVDAPAEGAPEPPAAGAHERATAEARR
jgi:MOSC domain-containing protein YiiM